MNLSSLAGLRLASSTSFTLSSNLHKVPLRVAGSLCNDRISTVPGKRYSIP